MRPIPRPEAKMGTLESGSYLMGSITSQPGLYASLGEGFAYEGVKFSIVSCDIVVLNQQGIFTFKHTGTAFSPDLYAQFHQLACIRFYNIKASLKNAILSTCTRSPSGTATCNTAISPEYVRMAPRFPQ